MVIYRNEKILPRTIEELRNCIDNKYCLFERSSRNTHVQ